MMSLLLGWCNTVVYDIVEEEEEGRRRERGMEKRGVQNTV
jgi:hypothetical protein